MTCNLSDQAGPGINEEVTSPSWENREKFAASREKWFLTGDTPQKHDYIISSYEPLADLFFLYFNIGPNNNKTKINNQKKCIHKDLIMATFPCKSNKRRKKKKKRNNQYLAHMTKTLVICTKYTYYKIKFAHYYL